MCLTARNQRTQNRACFPHGSTSTSKTSVVRFPFVVFLTMNYKNTEGENKIILSVILILLWPNRFFTETTISVFWGILIKYYGVCEDLPVWMHLLPQHTCLVDDYDASAKLTLSFKSLFLCCIFMEFPTVQWSIYPLVRQTSALIT